MPMIVADERAPSENVMATGTAPTAEKPTPTAKMTRGPRYAGEMSGMATADPVTSLITTSALHDVTVTGAREMPVTGC